MATAAALLVTAAAPASIASARAVRPTFQWSFTHAHVDAGKPVTVNYQVHHHPRSGMVALQRTFGTDNVFKTVQTNKRWSGTLTTTAPAMGRYSYRLAIVKTKASHATTKAKTLWSYNTVPLGTILHQSSHTTDVNGTLFRYVAHAGPVSGWSRILKRGATSCDSIHVDGLYKLADQIESHQAAQMQVEQEDADPVTVDVPAGTIASLDAHLTGHSFVLRFNVPDHWLGGYYYINGSAHCWTSNAAIPK